jgi:hypothetical protein
MSPDSAQEQPNNPIRISAAARALAPLVDERREVPEWPHVLVSAPLFMYDVLRALDVTPEEIAAVSGAQAAAAVAAHLDAPAALEDRPWNS